MEAKTTKKEMEENPALDFVRNTNDSLLLLACAR